MPQATSELTEEWDGPDDSTAIRYLKDRGYKLTQRWTWVAPGGREPTQKECRAVLFLIQEWDF